MKSITIATEDELSEQVAVRLALEAGLDVSLKLRKNGNGYLRSSIDKFVAMASRSPVLLITDLDKIHSPERLVNQWLNHKPLPHGLLFHVAIREVEAWLLADHSGMGRLLGRKIGKLPDAPESLPDPKVAFLGLAAKAPRDVRGDLVAERNSMASQGLGYNARLGDFVRTLWRPKEAAERSPSLAALRSALALLNEKG